MSRLVRAELLALRTTRAPWALAATAVLLTLVLALTPVVNAGKPATPSLGTGAAMLAVLGATGRGALAALVLGVLVVTTEFRYATLTPLFLRTPRRWRVLAAKAAAGVLAGVALGVVDLVVVLGVGLPSGAVPPSLLNADVVLRVAGLLLGYPLYGVLGVGLGALLQHQALAVVLPLAWLLFVEDLLLHLVPHGLAPWALAGVTAALANAGDVARVLPVWVGGVALAGYALALAGLGAARVARRDVT